MEAINARAATVRAAVDAAARRVGRPASEVTIVAVTKTFPPAAVQAAIAAGFTDVGENYVQEGRAKRTACGPMCLRWHLIGGLQRNKVRAAVTTFDRLHTVDSLDLGKAIDVAAAGRTGRMPILLQVNIAEDPAKRGALPAAAADLARGLVTLPHLALDGLMTIGPRSDEPGAGRAHFRALRQLRDDIAGRLGVEMPHLSMGMSDDFEIAIEEGATLVRLGRVLLGDRQGGPWREDR